MINKMSFYDEGSLKKAKTIAVGNYDDLKKHIPDSFTPKVYKPEMPKMPDVKGIIKTATDTARGAIPKMPAMPDVKGIVKSATDTVRRSTPTLPAQASDRAKEVVASNHARLARQVRPTRPTRPVRPKRPAY